MKNKKRFIKDLIKNILTYCATTISVLGLFAILLYIFINGVPFLSLKFITSDYSETLNVVSTSQSNEEFTDPNIKGTYFISNYGIAIKDDVNVEGKKVITVSYVAVNSPFNNLNVTYDNTKYKIKKGEQLDVLIGESSDLNDVFAKSTDGAEKFAESMRKAVKITYLQCKTNGGGIRGSLITTIYLIGLTLLFSMPIGVCASIYLVLYANNSKLRNILINMIDATSGIPSIIFGFVGSLIFIPFVSTMSGVKGYSVFAGALTMTIVLLPTIIKVTSESLEAVPSSFMSASLALGASKTQAIFKVILPNALPGILTAGILGVARIIGESAALIFVMGTSIEDNINLFKGSTTLSLHIWSLTSSEVPNYQAACAISIIILLVVIILNIVVKIITKNINTKRNGYGRKK